ncbi:MAG: DUF885 family protein, partial [Trebonia sp.]
MPDEAVTADDEFAAIAADYLDDLSRRHPDTATELGDHRFDSRLPERSEASASAERAALAGFTGRLDRLDMNALSPELRVDAELVAERLARRIFELDELREDTWNPLAANPGQAIYGLLARDFAPLPDRLASVAGRLAQVPEALADARRLLSTVPNAMPKVHLETATTQFDGTIALVRSVPDSAEIGKVRPAALDALAEHRDWLSARLAGDAEFADPRIGQERFARKLSLTLSAEADADAVLTRAEADLDRVTEEITELAASLGGTPREVLDRLAADAPDGDTILRFCADALAAQTAFVAGHDLVTLYDDPVE